MAAWKANGEDSEGMAPAAVISMVGALEVESNF